MMSTATEERRSEQSLTGGCACGAIRSEISAEPMVMADCPCRDCQCRDCQQRSGTRHGAYVTFPRRNDVKLVGTAAQWDIAADIGNVKTHAFCPACGTPVYLTFEAMPDLFTVHAANLDEPGRYAPQTVFYTALGHGWDRIDPSLATFDRMPPG